MQNYKWSCFWSILCTADQRGCWHHFGSVYCPQGGFNVAEERTCCKTWLNFNNRILCDTDNCCTYMTWVLYNVKNRVTQTHIKVIKIIIRKRKELGKRYYHKAAEGYLPWEDVLKRKWKHKREIIDDKITCDCWRACYANGNKSQPSTTCFICISFR